MTRKLRKAIKARKQAEAALKPFSNRSTLWSSLKGQIVIPAPKAE